MTPAHEQIHEEISAKTEAYDKHTAQIPAQDVLNILFDDEDEKNRAWQVVRAVSSLVENSARKAMFALYLEKLGGDTLHNRIVVGALILLSLNSAVTIFRENFERAVVSTDVAPTNMNTGLFLAAVAKAEKSVQDYEQVATTLALDLTQLQTKHQQIAREEQEGPGSALNSGERAKSEKPA